MHGYGEGSACDRRAAAPSQALPEAGSQVGPRDPGTLTAGGTMYGDLDTGRSNPHTFTADQTLGCAMRLVPITALAVICLMATPVLAQSQRDDAVLNENQASAIYQGRVKYPDYNNDAKRFSFVRTGINSGVGAGPNFAGKYAITILGCGARCAIGYRQMYQTDMYLNYLSALEFPNPFLSIM